MFLRRLYCLLMLSPVCASLPASEIRGVWREIAPLPSARQEVAVTALGKDVYVIGGLIPGGATNGVAVFDADSGQWSEAPPLLRTLHHAAAVQVDGLLYSIGGFFGFTFNADNGVFEFNPELQQWREVAPLPQARGALAAAVIDGEIYAVGGSGPGGDSGSLFRYDPETDQWATLQPMPTPRNHHAAAAINGKLYVVGGRRSGGNLGNLEIYDPASGQWESGPPMPTPRSGVAAVAHLGLLFVFGGEIPGVFEEVEVLDPDKGGWFSLTPMPLPRHGIGAAVYRNRIIIPGGAVREGLGATAQGDEFRVLDRVQTLAQFADSPEIVSQLIASNFGAEPVEALVEVRGDSGDLLPILADGAGAQSAFILGPGETRILGTPGTTLPPGVGYALVFSDRLLLTHVLFSSDFGFAGVLGQAPLRGFGVPVLRDVSARTNSGVALANVEAEACTISLSLQDLAGGLLAEAEIDLLSSGHQASFLDQLFPQLNGARIEGSLTGTADCDFGAMALLLRGDQLATLPVQAIQ